MPGVLVLPGGAGSASKARVRNASESVFEARDRRSRDPLKGWTRKDAALTDMFMMQQSVVDVTGLDLKFVEVDESAEHPEVGRVVDHSLDPQRAALFEV